MDLGGVLDGACAANASDIHLQSGMSPILRVHGAMRMSDHAELPSTVLLEFLSSVVPEAAYTRFMAGEEVDGAFSSVQGRWRIHAYHTERGVGLALRRLPKELPSVEELGLPAVVRDLAKRTQGLILVTGATGSGKTTTAASMLTLISQSRPCHIVTIEDPIEHLLASPLGVVSQREVGRHTSSFAQALRATLREDPDVIFVGEMRDLETMRLALQAAETGHLVISTLHTSGASRAASRVIDVFPAEQQAHVRSVLAETVAAVISQELVPLNGGGRALVSEVLIGAPSVRAIIRDGKFHQLEHVMQTSSELGMRTRASSLDKLRSLGRLAPE